MNQKKLSQVLNTIPNGIQENDTEGKITYSNMAHHQMLGLEGDQLIGHFIWDFQIDLQSKQELRDYLKKLLTEQPTPIPYTTTNLRADGQKILLEVIWDYQRNKKSIITGFISIITDITKKKKIEEDYWELYEQLKIFKNVLPDALFIKDGAGRWQVTNQLARALFQLDDDSWKGKTDAELALQRPDFKEAHEACIGSDEYAWQSKQLSINYEEVIDSTGNLYIMEVRKMPTFTEEGERKSLVIIARDVTEQKCFESNLKALGNIINNSLNEIYVFDMQSLFFSSVNQSALTNLGYSLEEMMTMRPYDIKPQYTEKSFKKALSSLLNKKNKSLTFETEHIRKNGTVYPVEVHLQLITGHNKDQYVAFIFDKTEQNKADAIVQHQTYYDKLTNLPNRTLFIDRLQQAIKQSHRSNKQIAVLFLDLDRFKAINDSLGHDIGNQILKEIAQKLKRRVRETDSIARFGGDEFGVIIDYINDINMVNDIISDIIKHISKPIQMEQHQLYITASIGVSIYPADGDTPEILLRNADSAMYKAKEEGGNTYQYYTKEMTTKAFEYILMEGSLRQALEKNEFILYYQPQVLAKDGRIFGMEALVRWKHPQLGMISPAKFIPLAEETGLIVPLGEEIFNMATKQIVQWNKNTTHHYRMAINLSVKQLQQKNIIHTLSKILQKNQCDTQWIELEVTEGYVMKNPQLAIKTLQHFSNMGIEIAIDDFGTGYSSLSYLKRLPINKLKIDQSFVRDLTIDKDDKAIVQSIIYLSNAMNLKVIAEGVETAEQKDFLQQQGCQEIQGYLYSKPVTSVEMKKLLDAKFIH